MRQAFKKDPNSLSEDICSKINSIADDIELSYVLAKEEVERHEKDFENDDEFLYLFNAANFYLPYAALAWHYFYGAGCMKDLEKAKRFMRHACTKEGVYWYPAYIQLVKEMNLENELKYNPPMY